MTVADAVPALRVGQGFDIHRFSGDPGRPLVLGGVTIAGVAGLAGHSDADVLLHDAFLLADEVPAEAFFGHAAIDYAIGLGRRAGARRVVLTHHKPGRTDAALDEVASRVAGVPGEVAGRPTLPEVIVAAEGEIFEL